MFPPIVTWCRLPTGWAGRTTGWARAMPPSGTCARTLHSAHLPPIHSRRMPRLGSPANQLAATRPRSRHLKKNNYRRYLTRRLADIGHDVLHCGRTGRAHSRDTCGRHHLELQPAEIIANSRQWDDQIHAVGNQCPGRDILAITESGAPRDVLEDNDTLTVNGAAGIDEIVTSHDLRVIHAARINSRGSRLRVLVNIDDETDD